MLGIYFLIGIYFLMGNFILTKNADNYSLCGNLTYFMAACEVVIQEKNSSSKLKTICLDSFPN